MGRGKLTENARAQIVALYAAGGESHTTLAKKFNCSPKTIERTLAKEKNLAAKIEEAKKAAEIDVAVFVKARSNVAMELFDDILTQLRHKLPTATPRELFGGLKIISEVFGNKSESINESDRVNVSVVFADTTTEVDTTPIEDEPKEEHEEVVDDDERNSCL